MKLNPRLFILICEKLFNDSENRLTSQTCLRHKLGFHSIDKDHNAVSKIPRHFGLLL